MKKLILLLLVSIIMVTPVVRATSIAAGPNCDEAREARWLNLGMNWACAWERFFEFCSSQFGDPDTHNPPGVG